MRTRMESIDQIRQFNRRYVPLMRLLDRSYLDTSMSTLEADALLEIAEHEGCSARDISALLGMDKGYLSRTINRFEDEGLVSRRTSSEDARKRALFLTDAGRDYVAKLTTAGEKIVDEAFGQATDAQMAEVADALARVLAILERRSER